MSKDKAYELLTKEVSGGLSSAETQELEALLRTFPELAATRKELQSTWELTGSLPTWEPDVAAGLAKLQTTIQLQERKPAKQLSLYKNLIKIAAVGIILIGATFLIRNAVTGGTDPQVFAANNNVEAIQMTDGSSILLDQAAQLTFFPAEKSLRKVGLSGQAFFDVARNEDKPFIVTTANAQIEVLGTSFNVEAESKSTVVIVRSGVVKVTDLVTNESVTLKAGESTVVEKETGLTKIANQEVPFDQYKDYLRFDNQPVEVVFQRLGWSFGKKINWDRKALKNCTLTSNLEKKSLEDALAILQEALNLEQFQIKANAIDLIGGGQCKLRQ